MSKPNNVYLRMNCGNWASFKGMYSDKLKIITETTVGSDVFAVIEAPLDEDVLEYGTELQAPHTFFSSPDRFQAALDLAVEQQKQWEP